MNKALYTAAGTVVGAAISAVVTWKVLERKYEKIAQEEIDSVKEMYRKHHDRVGHHTEVKFEGEDGVCFEAGENLVDANEALRDKLRKSGRPHIATRSSIDQGGNAYDGVKRDYSKLINKMEKDPLPEALVEAVMNSAEEDDVAEDEVPPKPEYPYLISEDQYAEERDEYEKLGLIYYSGNQILCDEMDVFIEDEVKLIGPRAITRLHNEPENMWVRNEEMETDFEIIAVNRNYGEGNEG